MHNSPHELPSVLVVEDDSEIAEFLMSVLGDAYAVASAGDVSGALARLAAQPPDVIVLDCLLPGVSIGVENLDADPPTQGGRIGLRLNVDAFQGQHEGF